MSRIPIFSLIIFLFTPLTVFGQTTILNNTDANQAPIVIASVSIDNFQYTYDESTRKLRIDFIFTNEGQSMNGVNYSLSISSSNGAEKSYIYNKDIYLASNVNSPQTIEETIPSYIYGNVTILVQAKNSSGIPLVTRIRDNIDVKQTGDTLHLDSQSCYLTVSTSTTKYNLIQGVDIDPSEQLLLNCNVINPAKKSYTLTPSVKTYERSISGPFVEESTLSTVSVKNATSTIKISIPLPTKPQAYSSVISISNLDQTIGDVSFHYVVRGESGTVHLVQMDKKSYYANDTAKVTLLWSPRADIFPGARVSSAEQTGTLLGKLYMSQDGKPCADTTSFEPSKSLEQTLNIIVPMKTNCNGYNTRIEIKDTTTNKTIVDMSFDTPKDNTPQPINWIQYAIALGVLILCIILIIVLIKIKKKHIDSKLLLLLVMLAGSLGVAQTARAYLLSVTGFWDGEFYTVYANADFEIFKSNGSRTAAFGVGDTITIRDYGTAAYMRCANGAYVIVHSKASVSGPGVNISESYGTIGRSRNARLGSVGNYMVTLTFRISDVSGAVIFRKEYTYSKTITVNPILTMNFGGTGTGSIDQTITARNRPNTYTSLCTGPSSCSKTLPFNSSITINARNSPTSRFISWSGACTGSNISCTVVQNSSKNVTANFELIPPDTFLTPSNIVKTLGACNTHTINFSWDIMSGATSYAISRLGGPLVL